MHPQILFNNAQVIFHPTYTQVPVDQNIANQLMSQYCNLGSMISPAHYISSNLITPNMSAQNQQFQIQQIQQLQQQQQQQFWIQNGLYLNQYPQVSAFPVLVAQKSDNEDFAESREDDSFTIRQRGKQTCDSMSTMVLNSEQNYTEMSKISSKIILNQQNQNNQFLIQNSSPVVIQSVLQQQQQQQQLQQQQQQQWNPFLSRNSELGNFSNDAVKNNIEPNSQNQSTSQGKDHANQYKIIYTDSLKDSNNSNRINTPTTSTSYKLIQNPPSISTTLSTTLSAHESLQQLPKIKKEVILDSEDESSQMNLEENPLSSECQQEQFSLNSVQINKDLDDAFKSMQSTLFYQNSELIFAPQYGKQFKLKQSHCKNDDIVFSKIKEYRKNRRHQSNSNELENASNPCKVNSKFHNLNKLFMYKLLATFSQKNLIELDVPSYLHGILLKLIMRLKQSTKEMKNYNKKTEFFSHDHYNLLFLHLTERTLKYLIHSPFSIYLHKLCFNLDLNQLDQNDCSEFIKLNNEKIQYINIIKRFCCQIVQNSNMLGVYQESAYSHDESNKNSQNNEDSDFDASQNNESSESGAKRGRKSPKSQTTKSGEKQISEFEQSQRQNMRQAYTQRALKGILSLNQGVIIRRF